MTEIASPTPAPVATPGWIGALTSTDHKRIGLNLGLMSLVSSCSGACSRC